MRTEKIRSPREILQIPEIGIVYPKNKKSPTSTLENETTDTLLVYVLNRSDGGLLMESPIDFDVDSQLTIHVRFPNEETWRCLNGRVAWMSVNPVNTSQFLLGIQAQNIPSHFNDLSPPGNVRQKRMYPSDLEFLTRTDLFTSISQETKCPLLNAMVPKQVKADEKLICQGEKGDSLYIIQEGSCRVYLEKNNTRYDIARPGAGEIVGEMSLLTTEPCCAHADAETDMTVWQISIEKTVECYKKYQDLRRFLTDLVTSRYSAAEQTIDRVIGKYMIEELIGQGAWSIVYKGTHMDLNMPVAIKMLKHNIAMDPDYVQTFEDEAKITAQLNHENIVKIYDIEKRYKTLFIIMEFFDGMSLAEVLAKMKRLPLTKALDILIQICTGLGYGHEHGIIHRDVKPDNIYLQHDLVKILDFGLACRPGSRDDYMPGTAFYMAPEQITGNSVDERADIYATGITAYELVTGVKPFPGDNIAELLEAQLHADIPDPRNLVPELPTEFYNILLTATRKDPNERYKNIWELLHAFRLLAEKISVQDHPGKRRQRQMMGFFLFYHDEMQTNINGLVKDLSRRAAKIGASLRTIDFHDT